MRRRRESKDAEKREKEDAISVRPLKPTDWPVIVELFGANGACGGCWCMWWSFRHGAKAWQEAKGKKNRDRFRRLVQAGQVHGVLAFRGKEPVGWCRFGPRKTFPHLESVRALAAKPWSDDTWSIVCFYIPARWRHRGVARRLLEAATARAFKLGAREVEGYPVSHPTFPFPAAFSYTGVPVIFERAGYEEFARPTSYRSIFRKARGRK